MGAVMRVSVFALSGVTALCIAACGGETSAVGRVAEKISVPAQTAAIPVAPPASQTGGFDGQRAYDHVKDLVAIGPRPPGSDAIRRAQAYIISQLKSYGCAVEEHDFHAETAIGEIAMKNIVVKIPGKSSGIVLYSTHYDTLRMPNFVGADDGGSGTGTLLELARILCDRKPAMNVWIAFFDGEEAQGNWTDRGSVQWTDENATFGSREMAASMALSGDLKRLKAMILADMIGPANLEVKPEANSTGWLTSLIWAVAARLGYANVFVKEAIPAVDDDHMSFIRRGVAGCDLIDFDYPYWHTPQDTLDKLDARSLAIVGHVLLETLPELEKKFP